MSIIRQNLRNPLCYLLLIGLIARSALLIFRFEELTDDRDAYLGIAENLMQGIGFCTSGSELPTAFRPPLYPLLLAVVLKLGSSFGLAMLHLLMGAVTIWATVRLGENLRLKQGAILAGFLVAIDPILLRYTTLPMTEVTFAGLTTVMLWLWSKADQKPSWNAYLLAGLSFGVALLCRPSLLPILAVYWVLAVVNSFNGFSRSDRIIKSTLCVILMGAAGMLVLFPWGVRNLIQFGHYKLTTTHGGYTLLLGNNPVFYDAVVRQPLGTTWGDYDSEDARSQTSWVNKLNRQLDEQGLVSEFDRDRAQYQLALENIRAEPLTFLLACFLREIRYWSPVPIGPEARQINPIIYWCTALFYIGLYVMALYGVVVMLGQSENRRRFWLPALAMILTFSIVHSIYWSNARMRAPLVPVIAMLAIYGLEKKLRLDEKFSL
ncbi:MAG: glycosyltransferase family 39 protein [Planctomycetaceae bacterium]|nr:glycosyltransferase family 39 protein [Planctomycetaceae bacterium]